MFSCAEDRADSSYVYAHWRKAIYTCKECGKKYRNHSGLRNHEYTQHDEGKQYAKIRYGIVL